MLKAPLLGLVYSLCSLYLLSLPAPGRTQWPKDKGELAACLWAQNIPAGAWSEGGWPWASLSLPNESAPRPHSYIRARGKTQIFFFLLAECCVSRRPRFRKQLQGRKNSGLLSFSDIKTDHEVGDSERLDSGFHPSVVSEAAFQIWYLEAQVP